MHKKIDWKIIHTTSVMGEEKLLVLVTQAQLVEKLDGDVAELGSYKGGSAILLAQVLPHKKVHAFESFKGLTNLSTQKDNIRLRDDERGHMPSDFAITDKELQKKIVRRLAKYNIQLHVGLFSEQTKHVSGQRFCLAHFDGDTYQSTHEFLEFFYPRLVNGGRLLFDDFGSIATPGVAHAVEDFFGKRNHLQVLPTQQAVFVKNCNKPQ